MIQLLFRNKYVALAWVGLSLFAAAAFVGEGDGKDKLDAQTEKLKDQQAAFNEMTRQDAAEMAAAEEDTPFGEVPDEGNTVKEGDYVTGPDGKSYQVVRAKPVANEELAE